MVTRSAGGAPLVSIGVYIYNAGSQIVSYDYTDESGHYMSGVGLPPGTYYARTLNYQGLINEVYDNTVCLSCDVTTGAPIVVTAGATIGNIDFALADGGTITGQVVYPPPSAGGYVLVDIYNGAGSVVTSAFALPAPSSYVVAEGLPAGTYYARTVNSLGLQDELYDSITCITAAGGVCVPGTGTPISVTAGATESNINFDLVPGGRIAGTVTDLSTGARLANVAVQIYNANGMLLDSVLTNSSGNYTWGSGLPSGTYFARTSNSLGYTDILYSNIACIACDVTTGTGIPVTSPNTTNNINFALSVPSATITLSATTVAPGATVTATIANGPGNCWDWVGLYATGAPPAGYMRAEYLNSTLTRTGPGADRSDADLHVAADAGHLQRAVLPEQQLHRPRDERHDHGRGTDGHRAECDDGGAGRDGDGDDRERAGQSLAIGSGCTRPAPRRPITSRRVSERHATRSRPPGLTGATLTFTLPADAGHLQGAVLPEQHASPFSRRAPPSRSRRRDRAERDDGGAGRDGDGDDRERAGKCRDWVGLYRDRRPAGRLPTRLAVS